MRCFFDIESTSIDPFSAEIIEGYFLLENGISHTMKSRVDFWNYEAEKIHGISYMTMTTYPEKKEAYRELIKFIAEHKPTQFICYANQQTQQGFITYDLAVIKMQLFLLSGNHTFFYKHFNDNPISVHSMAKKAAKDGFFTPIKGSSGRDSFKQENVYKAMFRTDYKAHSAIDDVIAMKCIHDQIMLYYSSNNDSILR